MEHQDDENRKTTTERGKIPQTQRDQRRLEDERKK
jgi:hypothetical protein